MRAAQWTAALTGVAAGAVALAVAGVCAAVLDGLSLVGGTASPLLALGAAFIDATPAWLKDWAIATFGTRDKQVLVAGMIVVVTLLCAGLGLLGAPRAAGGSGRRRLALAIFAALGAGVVAIVLLRPGAAALDLLPTALGVGSGIVVLGHRWRRADQQPDLDRRRVLRWAGLTTVLAAAVALVGQVLSGREQAESARADAELPEVTDPVTVPPEAEVAVDGMTPYVTPNEDFYRIDTAIVPPSLDPQQWRLRVHGMVRREVEIDYAELLEQPMIESLTTLACVSNTVGGNLVGNAVWTGWPIRELLARAEPLAEADMVLSTSSDGFTASTPLEALTDERASLLAIGMNGEPLPVEHGYPVRMVVPGLYGYVSATKWVVDLKVTTFDADVAYWTPRGWSARGPIKTSSRIDVPARSARVNAGRVVVAGVAWAQHRGIALVEIRVDSDGPWRPAELADEPTIDSWRQWYWHWDAPVGKHTLSVRATDSEGAVQISESGPPAPDGATGLHTIYVHVQ
ncbi:molybdopterin-dependent oxidoreductase [Pseudactinotalea sp.]|uniref:molybdopterin-dependent oxidoreductase n=1 Tax=Pseudactinotalea sp. TaxID=1926260 RepID=UPI003B3B51A3